MLNRPSPLLLLIIMHSMICHHLNAKKQEMSFGNYYHNANANNRIKGKRKQTKNSDVVGGGLLLQYTTAGGT